MARSELRSPRKRELASDLEMALEADLEITGGRIYDALLARPALKAKAETIYTWNLAYFQPLVPQVADRIRTP